MKDRQFWEAKLKNCISWQDLATLFEEGRRRSDYDLMGKTYNLWAKGFKDSYGKIYPKFGEGYPYVENWVTRWIEGTTPIKNGICFDLKNQTVNILTEHLALSKNLPKAFFIVDMRRTNIAVIQAGILNLGLDGNVRPGCNFPRLVSTDNLEKSLFNMKGPSLG